MEAARDLTARAPLLLQEPGAAWRVARGRVDLFAVELVAGDPRGRRHGLATLSPGDPLFGVAAPASGVALVAVGMGEARVEPIDLAALGATECARIAERWVALLAAALPMDGGRAQTLLRAGTLADVEPGTTVAALRDPAWIADARAVELGGRPLAGALPVAGGLVLRARAAGTLEPLEGAAAIAAAAAWQDGLEALGQAVLAQLGERIAAGAEHHRTRIERRAEAGRAETEGTYSALRQVVERRGLAVAPGTDPVAVACRIAGLSQGLRVAEPARGHEEPVAARLRAVARASGFRAREVQLDEGWWRRDVGNLVGVAEDERPVALVRRRGRYELADPVQGTQAPLDRGSAALLAPTAFMLYAGLEPEPATGRRVIGLGLRPARADLARLLATSLILGLLSIATPVAAGAIFTTIVPEGARGELLWIALVLAGVAVGTAVASLAQGLALLRVEAKASTGIQAAVIDRLLALPASFFRRYSAGDLGSRALAVDTIRQSLTTSVVAGLMALLVALFNVLIIL